MQIPWRSAAMADEIIRRQGDPATRWRGDGKQKEWVCRRASFHESTMRLAKTFSNFRTFKPSNLRTFRINLDSRLRGNDANRIPLPRMMLRRPLRFRRTPFLTPGFCVSHWISRGYAKKPRKMTKKSPDRGSKRPLSRSPRPLRKPTRGVKIFGYFYRNLLYSLTL